MVDVLTTWNPRQIATMLGLPTPTDEQAAVIEAPLRSSAIVAGAGSGKTETMAARVVWLVLNRFMPPDRVLGLTFTRKAAAELAIRIRARLRTVAARADGLDDDHRAAIRHAEPTVLTYDSYARRIVQEHGLRIGVEPQVRTGDTGALWVLAHRVITAYDGPLESTSVQKTSLLAAVIALADELAAHLSDTTALEAALARTLDHVSVLEAAARTPMAQGVRNWLAPVADKRLLLPLLDEFDAAKRDHDLMSFGDVMAAACRIATGHPQVGELERERFDAVLLDEYQDTSAAQAILLRALYDGHPVTAVGDPCQAIYGFRGASADTLAAFRRQFTGAGGVDVYRLQTSFRNDRSILGLANVLSEPLRTAGADVAVLGPGPVAGEGTVEVRWHEDIEQEIGGIADDIAAQWSRPAGERDSVAVLFRSRGEEFAMTIDALRDRDIPVEVVGLGGLLDVPEVATLVAILKVLVFPDAGVELVRLLVGARWKIGPRDLQALARHSRLLAGGAGGVTEADPDEIDERSVIEALDHIGDADPSRFSAEGYARLTRLAAELRALRGGLGESLADVVSAVERISGLDVEVSVRDLRQGQPVRTALNQFTALAHDFSGASGTDALAPFLEYLDAALEQDRGLAVEGGTPTTDAVQILTAHAAKGLEWDTVYVPMMSADRFPAKPKVGRGWMGDRGALPYELRGDRASLPANPLLRAGELTGLKAAFEEMSARSREHSDAEERRLCYVAVTRARHRLVLTGSVWTLRKKPRQPSGFLLEARDCLAASGGQARVWADLPPQDAANPLLERGKQASWPPESWSRVDERVRIAASRVTAARVEAGQVRAGEQSASEEHEWVTAARLLLAERAGRDRSAVIPVEIPARLSATELVAIARDPEQFAMDLRRPVPRRLASAADRGTRFHSFIEHRFGSESLIDIEELPGAADEDVDAEHRIDDLIAAFERSAWAGRRPLETETGFDLVVDGIPLRGRLDAVFEWDGTDADYDVIDWKTGRVPEGDALRTAEMQLAVYRIAWARLAGVPVERVRAGFHYVLDDYTHRPAVLPDEEGLLDLVRALPGPPMSPALDEGC